MDQQVVARRRLAPAAALPCDGPLVLETPQVTGAGGRLPLRKGCRFSVFID